MGYDFQNGSNLNVSVAYVDLDTDNHFLADLDSDDDSSDDEPVDGEVRG